MNLRYCETDIVYFFFLFQCYITIYAKLLCVGRGYLYLINSVATQRRDIEEANTLGSHYAQRGVLPFSYL